MFKKIIVLTLLSIFSLAFFSPKSQVIAEESDFEYTESFGLTYEDYKKDGIYVGDERIYLKSSGLTGITFSLEDQIASLTYPAFFEIDEIYLEVDFSPSYISDNTQVFSPDSTMVKEDYVYSPDLSTTLESDKFYHYFSISDISSISEYSTTFYYSTDNPAADIPFIFHSVLYVHYVLVSDALDDVIDVGTNYGLLPDTYGDFIDIFSLEVYDEETLSYEFMMIVDEQFYSFDVAIPEEIYNYDYISPYEEDPVHFVDFEAFQMSYSTNDGDKVLYIQPVQQRINHPVISESDPSQQLVVGFVTINLTTMEYEVINKLELVGVVNKEADRFAALYCFFPAEVDELLSITVTFEYRINSVFGIKGDWQTAKHTYVHGESFEGQVPNWIWWIPFGGWIYGAVESFWGDVYDIEDLVMPIHETEIPDEVIYNYVNVLNGSLSDLDDLALYKVTLGQFQDSLFTAATDENAYDITEFVILEILYSFDGKVYYASTDIIESTVLDPEPSGNFFGITTDFDMNIVYWVAGGIAGVYLFNKLHLDKKPGLLLLIAGAVLFVLYKLGLLT